LPDLETERLNLRKLRPTDAADIFEYASDPQVARYTTWEAHTSLDDAVQFVELIQAVYVNESPSNWTWGLELKDTGKLIGTIAVWGWPQHARAEVGYAIGRPYWGRGLVTEAVREVLKLGFDALGLNRIEARCVPENIGSARVMEKVGMTYEGLLREQMFIKGTFDDMRIYSILRREYYGEHKTGSG
jgi:ribosomal-protein-alanine N-acetyltransferase